MFGLGIPELIVIFIIALIVFGPKKLPELGKSVGRAMAEFKKASQEFQESMHAEIREVEKSVDLDEIKKLGKVELPDGNKSGEEKPADQPTAEQKSDVKKNEENKGNA
jgi:sec-independent protein translocase protein TatA